MLVVYLTALITALYFVSKTLLPEMAKPAQAVPLKPNFKPQVNDFPELNELDNRIEKLESFLAEKNKNISLLQTELKIFQVQVRDFDKVKTLMETEILRLREQNRIFRSELGLPTNVQPKENSIT